MKTPKIFYLIPYLFLCSYSISQVSQQEINYYNSPTNGADIPKAMVVDNSGNIFVTGTSPTSTTGDDIATVKYNSSGVQQWAVRYNSAGTQDDEVQGIAIDNSGNIIVTGSTVTGSSGVQVTIKYNSSGILQWAKQLGVPGSSPAGPGHYKSPVATDAGENIYVGGSRIFGGDNGGMMLIKYNSSGDSVWSRRYKGTQSLQGLGSSISCIKVSANFIYAVGKTFDMNPNMTYSTLLKYSSSGVLEWMRKDTLMNGSDEVTGMETDASGNIIVICNYGFNTLTYKCDSSGQRLWKKSFTGISGDYYDRVTGVSTDPSDNVYITGSSVRDPGGDDEDFLTVKYDPSGNQQWERFYDGTLHNGDYSKGISADASGSVYVTGVAFDTGFDFNYMTIKYDSDGVEKWKISYSGGADERRDEALAIAVDPSGNVIVTGSSNRVGNSEDYATIKYSQTVGVTQISSNIPGQYSLSQNYPNPFNPVTKINYELRITNYVKLSIYNSLGATISTLVNEKQDAGSYEIEFDASNLPSGIYFYKLSADGFTETKKMNLIK